MASISDSTAPAGEVGGLADELDRMHEQARERGGDYLYRGPGLPVLARAAAALRAYASEHKAASPSTLRTSWQDEYLHERARAEAAEADASRLREALNDIATRVNTTAGWIAKPGLSGDEAKDILSAITHIARASLHPQVPDPKQGETK